MPDTSNYHVVLAHEELACILRLFGVEPTIGADDNPLRGLPAEQVGLALDVAGRTLRARGLLRAEGEGQPTVQDGLLQAVGAYAFPERVAVAYHWSAGAMAPAPCYGYVRGSTAVLHQRPAPGLHEFVVLSSSADLISAMLRFCEAEAAETGAETGATSPVQAFRLPVAVLAELRSQSGAGQTAGTLAALPEGLAPADRPLVEQFVRMLFAQPLVTTFTTLRSSGPEEVDLREFTFLQQNGGGWLLMPDSDEQLVVDVSASDARSLQDLLHLALTA